PQPAWILGRFINDVTRYVTLGRDPSQDAFVLGGCDLSTDSQHDTEPFAVVFEFVTRRGVNDTTVCAPQLYGLRKRGTAVVINHRGHDGLARVFLAHVAGERRRAPSLQPVFVWIELARSLFLLRRCQADCSGLRK